MSERLRTELARFDGALPLERARTIPASWYFDREIADLERRVVFGDTWQIVGRTDQIAEPGSYLTAIVAGEPLLVVRGADGTLRAFYNVCRHRAAPLMTEAQGKVTKLRCRYHGWTYDLAGQLRGTPEFEGVQEFCKEEQGLVPLTVATWGPLVCVHGGKQPGALTDYLSPLPARTADRGLDTLGFVERREYELACNWKVYVDNYLDGGYHVNSVHPGLAGVLDYTHYRTEVAGMTSVQTSPLQPPGVGDDAAVGRVRSGDFAQYWYVFPNFMMNVYPGVMDTNLVLPSGPERCRVVFDFYFAPREGEDAVKFMQDSIAVSHQVQREDVDICEEVQRGLASASFDVGRFSVRRETAGYHFHQLLARKLREETNDQ
jgi:choline monooxygenase